MRAPLVLEDERHAIAAVVGETGVDALQSLAVLMLGFYLTCFLFVVLVLGALLRAVTGLSIFKLMKYLGREYLLIFSTSSSEAALPLRATGSAQARPRSKGETFSGALDVHEMRVPIPSRKHLSWFPDTPGVMAAVPRKRR